MSLIQNQPASTSFRGFQDDERCRFRPTKTGGLRVVIRVTYACDLACPHCLIDSRLRDNELDTASWVKLLSELPDIGTRKALLTGGEPRYAKTWQRSCASSAQKYSRRSEQQPV
jgi:molybdenum cofactor biosynthesis enzyme MoaA